MSCPAHPIHLELNLWFYAVGEGTEPSWPIFRSALDVLMTLYLSRMVVWGEKPWAGLMSLPRGISTVFPWLHIKFLSWIARLNQVSLSKPIIIKFISPGDLLIFPFVNIFENNQRHSVRSGFKDNWLIDFDFGQNVKRKRLTPEITAIIGSYGLPWGLTFIHSLNGYLFYVRYASCLLFRTLEHRLEWRLHIIVGQHHQFIHHIIISPF